MDFEGQLNTELSRANTNYMAHVIGNSQELFDRVYQLMLSGEPKIKPRAAWVIETSSGKYPNLIENHVPELVKKLKTFEHPGTKRNVVKILARCIIPEKHLSALLSICFEWLLSKDETVAVKVYCMQVMFNAIPLFPELKQEFISIIEDQMPKSSAGFKSRGIRLMNKLNRMPMLMNKTLP